MSFSYYYRDDNEAGEVTSHLTGNTNFPLSMRVTENDGQTSALINLPIEEIKYIHSAFSKLLDENKLKINNVG